MKKQFLFSASLNSAEDMLKVEQYRKMVNILEVQVDNNTIEVYTVPC